MAKKLSCEPLVRKPNGHDLKTGGAREFHERQTVGVADDQNDPIDGTVDGMGRDVEIEPHITLLLE